MKTRVIFAFIGIIFFAFVLIGAYQKTDKKISLTRLKCHENSTVFEKLITPKLLKKLTSTLQKGQANVVLFSKPSSYEKSTLFNFISLDKIEKMTKDIFHIKDESKNAQLQLYIYENDPKDPHKKNSSCKLFRGYITATFLYQSTKVYKMQIDFFDKEGRDIKDKLRCIFKSLQTF